DEERTFLVNFNLWQPQVPEEPTKKRKKTPGGPRGNARKSPALKYANFNPKLPTRVTLRPKTLAFTAFKSLLFASCNTRLPGVDEVLQRAWLDRDLSIQGYINASRKHKGNNKVTITNPAIFRDFVIASLNAPAHTVMGFKIIHENPLKTNHAKRSLAQFLREPADTGKDKSDGSDGEESLGSDGSDILSPGERNLRTLMQRFEQDFKAGENVTSVTNPKDPGQVCLLNTSRIRTWANDWADGVKGVDEVNPPMKRPEFSWINIADYEREKNALLGLTPPPALSVGSNSGCGGSVVHHNYYGQPGPMPVVSVPTSGLAAGTSLRLSPPPREAEIDFEKFLIFAGIGPGMETTRLALSKEGIHDFLRLLDRGTYTIATFHSWGIPFAQAEDIFKAIPKYNHYLKSI
ncbi:hypothetical protein DFH28DRAFT_1189371, partial [Melampsora americana]